MAFPKAECGNFGRLHLVQHLRHDPACQEDKYCDSVIDMMITSIFCKNFKLFQIKLKRLIRAFFPTSVLFLFVFKICFNKVCVSI